MISVAQVFKRLAQRRQQSDYGHNEPATTAENMVVSSRLSRGRPILRNEHQDHHSSRSSSPVEQNPTTTTSTDPDHKKSPTSRVKRGRVASRSDHESIQKRRRLGKSSGPPTVRIPLRGRAVPDTYGFNSTTHKPPAAPPLLTQESTVSNSPLQSPAHRPQYDQFKRIEEKAQKVVRKSINNDESKEDKRKLRSEHGNSRVKTELAQYFPAFDDMLSLEPVDPDLICTKTPIMLMDDAPNFEIPPGRTDPFRSQKAPYKAEIIDLSQYITSSGEIEDPLADTVYTKAHQKAERHEKQMKNGDKERAQHEKYQLEHLLEELRGPDWLKTLGISGITDSEKKRYEIKRTLFIRETKALIEKFRRWKEEEKRRKLERQQHQLEEVGNADKDDEDKSSTMTSKKGRSRRSAPGSRARSRASSQPASISEDKGADSSELDALASQQLLDEVKLATVQRRKLASIPANPPPTFEAMNKPFLSFFEKQHIRDAVMSGRNRGRKVYAFGQELPELDDCEFELPQSMLTEDAIKSSQRNRRRVKRSIDD